MQRGSCISYAVSDTKLKLVVYLFRMFRTVFGEFNKSRLPFECVQCINVKIFFFLNARYRRYVCRVVSCACNRYRSPTSKIILNTPRSRHGRKNRRRNNIIKITSVYYPPALMKTKLLRLARPYGRSTNNYETHSVRHIDNNII